MTILIAKSHAIYYTTYSAIYTAFLISFSADLFYISKATRLNQEEQLRYQEEMIDPAIFKRQDECPVAQ